MTPLGSKVRQVGFLEEGAYSINPRPQNYLRVGAKLKVLGFMGKREYPFLSTHTDSLSTGSPSLTWRLDSSSWDGSLEFA